MRGFMEKLHECCHAFLTCFAFVAVLHQCDRQSLKDELFLK